MEKEPREMSDREIYQAMRDRRAWDSQYFKLEAELEERNKE